MEFSTDCYIKQLSLYERDDRREERGRLEVQLGSRELESKSVGSFSTQLSDAEYLILDKPYRMTVRTGDDIKGSTDPKAIVKTGYVASISGMHTHARVQLTPETVEHGGGPLYDLFHLDLNVPSKLVKGLPFGEAFELTIERA
jgi:hypothetical protein